MVPGIDPSVIKILTAGWLVHTLLLNPSQQVGVLVGMQAFGTGTGPGPARPGSGTSNAEDVESSAQQRYIASCVELQSAISTLESALVAFVGKDAGDIKVFEHTRARLDQELSAAGKSAFSPE